MIKVYKIKYINCYHYCEEIHGGRAGRLALINSEGYDLCCIPKLMYSAMQHKESKPNTYSSITYVMDG